MRKETSASLTSSIVSYIKQKGGDARLFDVAINKGYRPKRQRGMPTLIAYYREKILFVEVKARVGTPSVEGKDGTTFLARCYKDFQIWFDKIQHNEPTG